MKARVVDCPLAEARRAIQTTEELGSTIAERQIGIPGRTLRRWARWYRAGEIITGSDGKSMRVSDGIESEPAPDRDIPIDELLDQKCSHYEAERKYQDAERWREMRPVLDGPIGIAMIGDPHLDDDGCNIPLVREHAAMMAGTEGVYAINIGDTMNNWGHRLAHLWANQRTNRRDAVRLADWFINGSGIRWLAFIYGNHDLWAGEPGEGNPLEYMLARKRNVDPSLWEAQLQIVFRNDLRYKIWASHSFPGSSLWNNLHPLTRAQKLGPDDVQCYVQGHHHEWGLFHGEDADTGSVYHLIRARGYEDLSSAYTKRGGYRSQRFGATVLLVLDPYSKEGVRAHAFKDLEHGIEHLNFLRSRWKEKS